MTISNGLPQNLIDRLLSMPTDPVSICKGNMACDYNSYNPLQPRNNLGQWCKQADGNGGGVPSVLRKSKKRNGDTIVHLPCGIDMKLKYYAHIASMIHAKCRNMTDAEIASGIGELSTTRATFTFTIHDRDSFDIIEVEPNIVNIHDRVRRRRHDKRNKARETAR